VGVVSNRPSAGALARADRAGIRAIVVEPHPGEPRADYDARLATAVGDLDPDWVVLAGWMRLLSMSFLSAFPGRVVNLHPALPGEFPGTNAIERAFDEFTHGTRRHTGVMVHLVPDEGVDNGPVLASVSVPIEPADTLDTLGERVHAAEHELLVATLATLCSALPTSLEVRSR
jgi:phosphoribosylglycinamide formyltransferase-1